jgi:hypothetical protein
LGIERGPAKIVCFRGRWTAGAVWRNPAHGVNTRLPAPFWPKLAYYLGETHVFEKGLKTRLEGGE